MFYVGSFHLLPGLGFVQGVRTKREKHGKTREFGRSFRWINQEKSEKMRKFLSLQPSANPSAKHQALTIGPSAARFETILTRTRTRVRTLPA